MQTLDPMLIAVSLGLCVVLCIIQISIVVWVHKDASRRGPNAFLWAIMVLFTSIPGLIIYLILRPPLPTTANLQQTPPNQTRPVQQQQQVPSSAPTRTASPLVGCLVAVIAVLLLVIVVAIAVPLVHKKILQNHEEVALETRIKQQQYEQKVADGRLEDSRPQSQPQSQQATAAATKDNLFVNSLGMKFVPVNGSGVMFCVWETRVQDYREYARVNSGVDGRWENPQFEGVAVTPREDCPVVCVSWIDAQAFCEWLTKKERAEGKISVSQSYRLPADWEWSVAVGLNEARDGTPRDKDLKTPGVYPWGTQWPPPPGAGNYADATAKRSFSWWPVIEDYDDGYATTAPVGSFDANSYGIYDLGGNVCEWCKDEYPSIARTRVLRGASWEGSRPEDRLLSSGRDDRDPGYRDFKCGFRVVLADDSSR